MLEIINGNVKFVPKTLNYLIWNKITYGIKLTGEEYNRCLKLKFSHIYSNISHFELIKNGCILYYKNGSIFHYKHGLLHREDDPAAIFPAGYIEYWIDGKHKERIYKKEYDQKNLNEYTKQTR